jgi:hypothetical protein
MQVLLRIKSLLACPQDEMISQEKESPSPCAVALRLPITLRRKLFRCALLNEHQ